MDATRTKTTHESTPSAPELRSFETRSVSYTDDRGRSETALFRLYPADRVAVLQHVRETEVDRGPTPAGCEIDTDARPVDLPDRVVDELHGDGFDVVGETLEVDA